MRIRNRNKQRMQLWWWRWGRYKAGQIRFLSSLGSSLFAHVDRGGLLTKLQATEGGPELIQHTISQAFADKEETADGR